MTRLTASQEAAALTARQRRILLIASDFGSITLRPHEIAAAVALKRKGLLDFGAAVTETVAVPTLRGRDLADLLEREGGLG